MECLFLRSRTIVNLLDLITLSFKFHCLFTREADIWNSYCCLQIGGSEHPNPSWWVQSRTRCWLEPFISPGSPRPTTSSSSILCMRERDCALTYPMQHATGFYARTWCAQVLRLLPCTLRCMRQNCRAACYKMTAQSCRPLIVISREYIAVDILNLNYQNSLSHQSKSLPPLGTLRHCKPASASHDVCKK